jgi:hypothetical protein
MAELFNKYDVDGQGSIDKDEFRFELWVELVSCMYPCTRAHSEGLFGHRTTWMGFIFVSQGRDGEHACTSVGPATGGVDREGRRGMFLKCVCVCVCVCMLFRSFIIPSFYAHVHAQGDQCMLFAGWVWGNRVP